MIRFTLWSESLSLEFPTSLPDTQRIWSAILTFTFPIPQNNFHFPSSPQWLCSCKRILFAISTFTFSILQNNFHFSSSPLWWSSCQRTSFALITFTFPTPQKSFHFPSSPQWWSSCRRTWSTCGTPPSPRSSTPSSSTVITIERLPFRFVGENHLLKCKLETFVIEMTLGPGVSASKILGMGLGDSVHKRASEQDIDQNGIKFCDH